ncbi:MAG: hypothetical protein SGCHY_003331 [Lobulomycetales sp.]
MTTGNAVEVDNLTFNFSHHTHEILKDLSLSLPKGSRTVLVGANGAGKSTFLRLLAGKRMSGNAIKVFGTDPFSDTTSRNICYLGTEFVQNPHVRSDVSVEKLLKRGESEYSQRCKELMQVMDVDPSWRMHAVSDGQRRRVQIVMGLIPEWDLLLLDEVTVDLDVLVRFRLFQYLVRETEQRGATIVYATHIFDGLDKFCTHLIHLRSGRIVHSTTDIEEELTKTPIEITLGSSLLNLVLHWLREDYEVFTRDAKKQASLPTKWDKMSEDMRFLGDRFYDYWKDVKQ